MYVLGALVFGVHMLFNSDLTTSDDASLLVSLSAALINATNWDVFPIDLPPSWDSSRGPTEC